MSCLETALLIRQAVYIPRSTCDQVPKLIAGKWDGTMADPHRMVKLGRYGRVVMPNRALGSRRIKSWVQKATQVKKQKSPQKISTYFIYWCWVETESPCMLSMYSTTEKLPAQHVLDATMVLEGHLIFSSTTEP